MLHPRNIVLALLCLPTLALAAPTVSDITARPAVSVQNGNDRAAPYSYERQMQRMMRPVNALVQDDSAEPSSARRE